MILTKMQELLLVQEKLIEESRQGLEQLKVLKQEFEQMACALRPCNRSHTPNALTAQVLAESAAGKNLLGPFRLTRYPRSTGSRQRWSTS